jgi:hypothetical protein
MFYNFNFVQELIAAVYNFWQFYSAAKLPGTLLLVWYCASRKTIETTETKKNP